ncbi:hypothetical protein L1S35_08185 [Flavobacterium sp. AS60]|uniref:hypothetical protein n=1 Tax=Flavobacterium anseongense TaxID=2910677 RepID=UPI001F2246AF|nr:hypothetical protein [Flavobacterium sp. AS60]MCF6129648.1 hypothetical protein [Flavobacterium sp. AS60]
MPFATIFEYTQSIDNPLLIEYFYNGEKIDDPVLFFELNPGAFELFFPSEEEIIDMINKKKLFFQTHKLIISEYGFHLIQL